MRVDFAPDVEAEIEAILEYIAVDNPRAAVRLVREIYEEIDRIGESPEAYQLRPDIGRDCRLAVVGRYVILFRIETDSVYIERVVQGSRQLPPLFH